MKKLISLALCLIILSACICMPVVYAEYEQPGASVWFVYPYNGFTADIGVDGTYKHHGNSSLKIVNNNDSSKSAKIATHTSNWITSSDIGSTYRMSFWVKTENILADSFYYLPSYLDDSTKKAVAAGTNDWTYYTTDFIINQTFMSNGTYLGFEIKNKGTIWIDEVSMRKVNGDGTLGMNTIANPSFEWYGFYSGGNKYDTTTAPNWTVYTQNSPYDMEESVVTNVKHSGNSSLRLTNNMGAIAYIYLRLFQNVQGLEDGKKYRYSFWVKSENKFAQSMQFRPCIDTGPGSAGFGDNVFGNRDWNYVSHDWTKDGSWGNTDFSIDIGSSGTLWLDDISVQCINADGSLGENIILNPGFEEGADLTPPIDVTNITVAFNNDYYDVAWVNPSDCIYSVIYRVDASGLVFYGQYDKEINSASITGLSNNAYYRFCIKSVDRAENVSSGAFFEIDRRELVPVDLRFYDPQTGQPLSSIQSGFVEARFRVRKPNDAGNGKVDFIVVIYQDKKMVECSRITTNITKNNPNEYEDFAIGFNILGPVSEGCEVKVFAWTANMVPIEKSAELRGTL